MRRLVLLSLSTAFLLLPACGSDDGPTGGNGGNGGGTTAAAIVASSGNGQRVAVGRDALGPLTVRVTDSQNRAVQNARVNWSVTGGGGSVSNASTTTDSDGEASVVLTAGSNAGDNTVSATVDGTNLSASFTIEGVAAAAAAKTAGDNQMARLSQPLAAAFQVRVTASDGGPVPNLPVSWQVTGGGGSLSATSTTTDADGRASSILTLGPAPGANSASATAGALAAQAFNATGTTPVSVQVDIQFFAFVAPGGGDDITIMLGDTVTWVNLDATAHTASSTDTPTGGTPFDSGSMSQNDTFSYVPDIRGEWVYRCDFHPVQMSNARITVQ